MVLCLPRVNDDQSEIQRLKLAQKFLYDRFKSIYSNVTEVDGISGTDQTVCLKGCCSTVTLDQTLLCLQQFHNDVRKLKPYRGLPAGFQEDLKVAIFE